LFMVVLLALVTIVLFSVLLYVLLRPPGRGDSAVLQAGYEPPAVYAESVAGMGRPVG
jgi:hypothetical protein